MQTTRLKNRQLVTKARVENGVAVLTDEQAYLGECPHCGEHTWEDEPRCRSCKRPISGGAQWDAA